MENPRPEKVAVVDEVRARLADSTASVVTEYRGLTVAQLAQLRNGLAGAGEYKIYKNTLVRLAVAGTPHEELTALLSGPTAITFVHGDLSAVAKTLRDFARTNPALVIKGGLVEGAALGARELGQLADLPSRDVLLAQLAGAIAAPLRQLAGLMQALPRNLAYGLSALVDQRGGAPTSDAAVDAAVGAEGSDAVSADAEVTAATDEAAGDNEAAATDEATGDNADEEVAPADSTDDQN
jgi:large subunit ribosomal protein L10